MNDQRKLQIDGQYKKLPKIQLVKKVQKIFSLNFDLFQLE
jgi:hypothetical protein